MLVSKKKKDFWIFVKKKKKFKLSKKKIYVGFLNVKNIVILKK